MLLHIPQTQQQYFNTGATLSYHFRKQQLIALQAVIRKYEPAILKALYTDLGKSAEEAYASEVGFTLNEIKYALTHLRKWMQPQSVRTNLLNLPGSSKLYYDPLGVVCIIAPWNYPFQLLIAPLIGAIAGGNCAVLKPSELAPATSALVVTMIAEVFEQQYIAVIEGEGHTVLPVLLQGFRFAHVFFTGSIPVGKAIYQMAAAQLIPVTLELGGKSPAIVTANANVKVAADRIVLGKCLNAGQTCVAPDYLLVHESVFDATITALKDSIERMYGKQPLTNTDYPKIISEKRFQQLLQYLPQGTIVHGGRYDVASRKIEPTLLTQIKPDSTIMQDEIFGPVLPIFCYSNNAAALQMVQQQPNPLALYVFTNNSSEERFWMEQVPFGGGCVNNTLWHLANEHLPFGGIGNSGIGVYHGKHSFYTFTHAKPVLKTPTWFNPAFKFPPFKGKMKLFKMFMK
jgi:aldehyde dehydrogenase (NAD+)